MKAGLRSPDAFVLRRCQILLASAEGRTAYQIARTFGCHDQTVPNAIYKFNEEGLEGALAARALAARTQSTRLSIRSRPRS